LVVFSPGSAEAYIGRNGKLNGHSMASCIGNTLAIIIKI